METLIASMVTIPSRRDTLQQVIDSLSRQTRRPDLLRLHYSRTRWHLDEGWRSPPRVRAAFPVELCEVPNVGSARKYLATLAAYRGKDVHVVLLDDDLCWAPYVFERLLRHAVRTRGLATTHGWYRGFVGSHHLSRARSVEVVGSGAATLFHVRHVDDRLFDRKLQRACFLRYSDEVFLSAMLTCRKFVIPLPNGFFEKLRTKREQWRSPKTLPARRKQYELLKKLRG